MRRLSRRFWIACSVAGLGLITVLWLLLRPNLEDLYVSPELFPRRYGQVASVDSKLRFFNGRAFVDYDPVSGQTSVRLADIVYPPVKEVQWNRNGSRALITSVFHSSADSFGKRLQADRQPLGAQRHWVMDMETGDLVLLASGVEAVEWSGETIVGTRTIASEETSEVTEVYSIDAASGKATLRTSVNQFRKLLPAATNDLYVVRKDQNVFKASKFAGGQWQDVGQSANDTLVLSPNATYVAWLETEASGEESEVVPAATIHIKETASGRVVKLEGWSIDTHISFLSNDQMAIVDIAGTPRLAVHTINQKTATYTPKKDEPALGLGMSVQRFGDKLAISTAESLQIVGFSPLSIAELKTNFSQASLSGDGFAVVKKESRARITSLTVNIYKTPVAPRYQQALELIAQQGLKTDLYDIYTDTSHIVQ